MTDLVAATQPLFDRIAAALARADLAAPLPHAGDDAWAARGGYGGDGTPAAVLVPFVDHPHPALLLTRRPTHMRRHSGQVAFPGGRADPGDADAVATALREAQEEVGLSPEQVRVIGTIAPYRTGTGFRVTPVLAVIPPDVPLVPSEAEVARIFEVRCDIAFDPAAQVRKEVDWEGGRRHYWEIAADGERVWGATAGMIRNIGALLGLADNPRALNRGEGGQ